MMFASWALLEVTVVTLHGLGVFLNVLFHLAFLIFFSGLLISMKRLAFDAIDGRDPGLQPQSAVWKQGAFSFFRFMATRGSSLVNALRRRASESKGHGAEVLILILKAFLLNLAGAALLGVGFFVTFPVTVLAAASLYRTLRPAR